MSYKTELQSNNTDLQAILDAVNTLPDGSSGKFATGIVTGTGSATLTISDVGFTPVGFTLVVEKNTGSSYNCTQDCLIGVTFNEPKATSVSYGTSYRIECSYSNQYEDYNEPTVTIEGDTITIVSGARYFLSRFDYRWVAWA